MTTSFHSHAQQGTRPPRSERVAELLRQEISQMMLIEMKDPRVRMASISEVKLARDMKSARVMVSAIGEERERRAVVTALRHAEGYLRGQLGERLESLKTRAQAALRARRVDRLQRAHRQRSARARPAGRRRPSRSPRSAE